jgi:hypothetical protein
MTLRELSTPNDFGFVSGVVDRAYTEQELIDGETGYTADDWLALNDEIGGATRFPLKNSHREEVGHILHTYVDHRGMLCASAMLDRSRPDVAQLWEDVRSKKVHAFSIGFDAIGVNARNSGKRRYKNANFEVSLTPNPVKEFATIAVRCSKDAMSTTAAAPQDTTSAAAAAVPPPAATPAAATPAPAATTTPVPATGAAAAAAAAPSAPMEVDALAELSKLSAAQIARFALEQVNAAREAAAREKAAAEDAEAWRKHRAAETERAIAQRKELIATSTAALKAHGMDVENPGQAAILDKLAQHEHTGQLLGAFASLAKENAKLKEQEEMAARAAAEAARERIAREEKEQVHNGLFEALRGFTTPTGALAAETNIPGAKRAVNNFNRVNGQELPKESASALGLETINESLFKQAAARAEAAAAAAPTNVTAPTPAARRDAERVDVPTDPKGRLALMTQCLYHNVDPPVAVKCSKEGQEPLIGGRVKELLASNREFGWRDELATLPPAFIEMLCGDTHHWQKEAIRIGPNGWRKNPVTGEVIDVAAVRRMQMRQAPSVWAAY